MEEQKTSKLSTSKAAKHKKLPVVLGVVFLAVVIAALGVIFRDDVKNVVGEKKLQTIVIGDETITPQDVKDYAKILNDKVASVGGSYEESEDTLALKSLVLNAALKKEANDLGISVSDEQIIAENKKAAVSTDIPETSAELRALGKTDIIGYENFAYKQILNDRLIIEQSLLIVQSNFDTPYQKQLPEDKIPNMYDGVLKRLNDEIKPMMKNGASAEEISKKVDVDFITNNKNNDQLIELYNSQPVVAIQRIDDYAPGTQVFNDLDDTDYIVGNVGELFNTDEKLAALKNVGDTTDVFASKSGLHMIARLDAANGGKYASWDAMLNQYFDQHVKYAGLDLSKYIANAQSFAIKTADKTIITLTNPALEQANAQGYVCSAHTVRYIVAVWVGGPGGGPGSAGGANPGVRFTPQPNGCTNNSPGATDGWLDRGDTGLADCMRAEAGWGDFRNVASPGFKYRGTYVDRGGGGPWSAGAYNWNNSGETPPGPKWDVANANATSNYSNYIWFVYEPDGGPRPGNLIVSLLTNTDANCTISGIATYRPPNTNGSADTRVPWRIAGGYTYPPGGGAFAGANAYRVGNDPRRLSIPVSPAAAVFPDAQGRSFTLFAQYDPDGNGPLPLQTADVTETIFPPAPFGCNPPQDYGAEAALTANCNGVSSFFARDRNGTAGYSIRAYYVGAGEVLPGVYNSAPAGPGASGSIPMNIPPLPGNNNGYYFQIDVQQVGIYGNPTGGYATARVFTGPCYNGTIRDPSPGSPGSTPTAAACTSLRIVSPFQGARSQGLGIEAGSGTFAVTATIRNNGPLPIPANDLAATYIQGGGHNWAGGSTGPKQFRVGGAGNVNPGEERTVNFTLNAPNRVSDSTTLYFYPDYAGYFGIGPSCALTIDVYKPYDIVPHAGTISLNDPESPTRVDYNSSAEKNQPTDDPVQVPGITSTRTLTNRGALIPAATRTSVNTYGNQSFPDFYGITTVASNDNYCNSISVSPAEGWIGPVGKRIDRLPIVTRTDTNPDCVSIVDKPYIRAYGGDVVAGAGFPAADGTCSALSKDIKANTRLPATGKSGSGGQFGVYAAGSIEGFMSSMLRTAGNPTAPKGLTFGNVRTGGSALSPIFGGNYQTDKCLEDYYTSYRVPDGNDALQNIAGSTVNVGALNDDMQSRFAGDITLTGTTNFNRQHSMFVDGNVYIAGNITMNTAYNVNDITSIPSFRLFVRGNIYIDRHVQQLDGVYVAQPNGATGGIIYTCASASGAFSDPASRYANCSANQLRVYGQFVANRVELGRTFSTLRNSTQAREPRDATQAAEVFIFSPDIYLSTSAIKASSTISSGDYQYIATLPPIL